MALVRRVWFAILFVSILAALPAHAAKELEPCVFSASDPASDPLFGVPRASFVARAITPARTPQIEQFVVRSADSTLRGIRYPKPGGIPVLAAHGFAENSRLFKELMRRLAVEGDFDVWTFNWRGHGRGSLKSRVDPGSDQGVLGMIERDLPALLEHVRRVTGQRVLFVGHSMGGMVSRATRAEDVFARVEIGSPRKLDTMPLGVLWLAPPVEWISRALPGVPFPFLVPNRAATDPDPSGISGLLNSAVRWFDPVITLPIPKGILNVDNLTAREATVLREKVLSYTPTDTFRDFASEIRRMKSGDTRPPFGLEEDPRIPTLLVTAELDSLAPPTGIYEAVAQDRASGRPLWTAEMAGFGHVDMVYGDKAAIRLAPLLKQFALDPKSLGAPGTHLALP